MAFLLACSSNAYAQPNSASFPAQMLAAHNVERKALGLAPLVWDNSLAAAATAYAHQLARTDVWGHSAAHQRVDQGENLWMGTRSRFSLTRMVGEWAAEKRFFRSGVFPNVSRSGSWQDVGHYTQMVWPSTTKVGCSVRSSAQWDYLVCRYSTPGNAMGQRVGPATMAAR